MNKLRRSTLRNRQGGTLVLFTVMLTGLLGAMALAVDVGMGLNARSEAQRVADASALAGASAYMDYTTQAEAIPQTYVRAESFATQNWVHGEPVLLSEVLVTPDWILKEVEVVVTRQDIPSWFSRFLGVLDLDVQARAVAKVSDASSASQCILPFTPPDIWHDENGDVNDNHLPDPGEEWDFDAADGDNYSQWNGIGGIGPNGTGYGSNHRGPNGDVGMTMYIKAGAPGQGGKGGGGSGGGQDEPFGPGNFLGWRMPDPDNNCETPMHGAEDMEWNILNCNSCPIGVGEEYEYETEPGNMASLLPDIASLIDEDPNAQWTPGCTSGPECITGSLYGDPLDSPRVRPVAFFDPTGGMQGASIPVSFSNIAWIFLEGSGDIPDFTVWARFVGRISGGEEGEVPGPLIQYLRLIE